MSAPDSFRRTIGLCWVVVGLVLFTLSGPLDGWLGGLASGACVASILVGVVYLSTAWRHRDDKDAGWLPSRDGDPR